MARIATVVGWDGSAPATQALEWAAEHEDRRGGCLHIVRVLSRDGDGEPFARVAAARDALERVVAGLAHRRPGLETGVELVVGDPVAELSRIAGHDHLLVLGASRIGRARRPESRRIPIALAARPEGVTAVVPAEAPDDRTGVLGVVCGREHSGPAIDFAVRAAMELREPLTFVRLHDPHDLDVDTGPVHLVEDVRKLQTRFPGLDVSVAPGWVSSPYGLLTRSDKASLLVLEGDRASAAPPRYSFERWLAGQARAPFAVVAEALPPTGESEDSLGTKLALAV